MPSQIMSIVYDPILAIYSTKRSNVSEDITWIANKQRKAHVNPVDLSVAYYRNVHHLTEIEQDVMKKALFKSVDILDDGSLT